VVFKHLLLVQPNARESETNSSSPRADSKKVSEQEAEQAGFKVGNT